MRIEVEVRQGVCVLGLNGRLQPAAYTRVRAEVEATGCRKVIIDCRAVPYLDAAGIGFVADLCKSLKNSGGELALANANAFIRKTLKITRLDSVIPIFDSE